MVWTVALLCLAAGATAKSRKDVYRVVTPEAVADYPVVIGDVPEWARGAKVEADGREIPSQLDDLDGDGRYDELAFVVDVVAESRIAVRFTSEPSTAEYPPRVHAQMWLKNPDKSLRAVTVAESAADDMYHRLHHHGPAFESERAAYRVYFDKKQSIDTYGKKRLGLELAETLWYPDDGQLAAGYGHDNLRVFGSVSVGALKPWNAKKRRMEHITEMSRREARIVASGPVRTIVDMRVEGWKYEGRELNMTSRYILYAGHDDVQVENRIEGDCRDLLFTTGVMKIRDEQARVDPAGCAAVWGCDFPENDTLKWERESVGLAIRLPRGRIVSQIDDSKSHLYQLSADEAGRLDYAFLMAWRKSEWLEVGSAEAFFGYADAWVRRLELPVRVERVR